MNLYYNFILRETKMADFERRQFEIGLKFVCRSFAELNNFSEGSSKPKKDAQVIISDCIVDLLIAVFGICVFSYIFIRLSFLYNGFSLRNVQFIFIYERITSDSFSRRRHFIPRPF